MFNWCVRVNIIKIIHEFNECYILSAMMEWYQLITLLVVIVIYHIWTRRSLPPGPWGLPVIGYLPWLDPKAPYQTLSRLADKYGPIYGLWMGSVYTVVVTDVKMIKTLFSKDSTTGRAPLYLTHGIMKGYGLICAEGDLWREHRRFIHNCLRQLGGTKTGHRRSKMESLIMKHVNELLMCFSKNAGVSIDPLESLRHSLGSAINSIVFGKSWSKDDEEWIWLQDMQEEGTKQIGIAGPLNFLPFLRFLPRYRQTMDFLLKGKHETHKVYQKIIAQRQQNDFGDANRFVENILEAFLLEKSKKSEKEASLFYNDQQFYHLLADIFGAGLDTTLTTLRWYLLYMAQNPTIQDKIRDEIQDVLQGRPFNLEDIAHLPLFEASICESQRIRSVVPVGIPHGAIDDLVVDRYRVPKGTMIVPLQWAIHMDEKMWPNPEKFDPWRFIDEEGRVAKPENFIPFQLGKRMCVGDELARMLLFSFGANIVQHFSFVLEDKNTDFIGDCGITLTPKSHKIIFTKTNIVVKSNVVSE
ncbi:unnamed protein product [Phaedon cochleariae]|uniref:Cytochrome P450 n=1 Tax=Phaedon cochleariae TaxID=80249 RepID=A0A9P0GL45_PHACE|nr:unnamed protein product [Phaedon cochleariae]